MRQPITKNVIKNSPEGPDVFDMEWVHQGLALIINNNEKNPGEAKEKNQTIKNEKGRETRLFVFFVWPIEPENLREGDKRNGAVTGIKQNREKESNKEKIFFLCCLKVFDKKVEIYHSQEHQQ